MKTGLYLTEILKCVTSAQPNLHPTSTQPNLIMDHLGRPPGSYPESFVKIWPNLARIWRCVTPAQPNLNLTSTQPQPNPTSSWFILGDPQEVILKVLWRSDFIWLRYWGMLPQLNPNLNPTSTQLQSNPTSSWIIFGDPQEVILKVSWRYDFIWLRYWSVLPQY